VYNTNFINMLLYFIHVYELFERKCQEAVSLVVIEKLQYWTLIVKNNTLRCIHGHSLKLGMFKS